MQKILALSLVLLLSSTPLFAEDQAAEGGSVFHEGVPNITIEAPEISSGQKPQFTDLARALSPAVVNISVESERGEEELPQIPGLPPFQRDAERPVQSMGSGFIISEKGYIVTSNHVIDKSDKIVVRLLDDKTEFPATVIGKDAKTDIALIKIDAHRSLPAAYLGDSDKLEVGEWVLAIGNQFQLGQTVTAGIVSAKSRRVPTKASGPYDQFIQTDASINPGSSGGPLINTKGQVIGINTAIFSPGKSQFGGTGFNIGIGFAAPINLAKGIVTQLLAKGKVIRGMLGVIIQAVTNDVAEAMGLADAHGALVADILKDSPAGKAGFKRKDVIVKYNGTPIKEHEDLPILVANTPIGSAAKIDIIRDGASKTLEAKIEELKEEGTAKQVENPKSDVLGLVVQEVAEDVAKALSIPKGTGVFVTGVDANSTAEKAGIMRGDVLEEIGGEAVRDLASYYEIIKKLKKDKPLLVLIRKKEGTRFLTLKFK